MTDYNFGPSGETVYKRTYSRPKPDGTKEVWQETVERVAEGNLALVHGPRETWTPGGRVEQEYDALVSHMLDFKIIPAGRHLWASGVKGRQYLMNCWTSGWTERFSEHFEFTFLRLMEGGGVGANYSSHFLTQYGAPKRSLDVHIVCDPDHPDYAVMKDAGILSDNYVSDWDGAFLVEDSREGWASALVDLLDTYMSVEPVQHENRVYDVSNVRGKGARLKTFGGTASGPKPFAEMMHEVCDVMNVGKITPLTAMEIDHAIAECVVSGGNRRSARMSIVRWDDPFVEEFISCKADSGKHWTTNISVEVDDQFFKAFNQTGARLPNGRPASAWAKRIHNAVMTGALTNGEPGYWNSTLSNHGEIVPVYATNPCGEITLQMFEACNLGHVNLDAFAPKGSHLGWDEGGLIEAHRMVTRFLMRATYADINDPKSRKVQDANRRIGVGHLGVQAFLVKSGWKLSDVALNQRSPGYHSFRDLLDRLYSTVRTEARAYAFALRIPEPIKVTTVAPTGSVAKLPGTTEGIHPILFRYFEQRIRFSMNDADQMQQVAAAEFEGFTVEEAINEKDTLIVVYPTKNLLVDQVEAMGYDATTLVEQADEISLEAHLAWVALYQKHYADNAVSYTVNVNAEKHQNDALLEDPWATPPAPTKARLEEVKATVLKYLPSLKGTTIMLNGSRPQPPYTEITPEQYEAAKIVKVEDSIDLDCATGACPIR